MSSRGVGLLNDDLFSSVFDAREYEKYIKCILTCFVLKLLLQEARTMKRRLFIQTSLSVLALMSLQGKTTMAEGFDNTTSADDVDVVKWDLSEEEWRKRLTPEQFHVLRKGGTEKPGSSPLDKEFAYGTYVCAGCELPLFFSDKKYDSGTGWPSFWDYIPGHLDFSVDWKLIWPRKEYHCAQCGGHQGHVFDDGPKEHTGLRYCNNGVALKFEKGERKWGASRRS